jgi:hypothetical protein
MLGNYAPERSHVCAWCSSLFDVPMQLTPLADNSNVKNNSEDKPLAAIQDSSFALDVSVIFTFQPGSKGVTAPFRRSKPSTG